MDYEKKVHLVFYILIYTTALMVLPANPWEPYPFRGYDNDTTPKGLMNLLFILDGTLISTETFKKDILVRVLKKWFS